MPTIPCCACESPVNYDPELYPGHWRPTAYCENCLGRMREAQAVTLSVKMREDGWAKLCPTRFYDTQLSRLPFPENATRALNWKFEHGHGLNFWGWPDTGKTRTLFMVLGKLHFAGYDVLVFTPGEFAEELGKRGYRRDRWVIRVKQCPYVAWDDFDKMTLTRDQELVLFAILDYRMSHKLPCLLTHNSKADELAYKFREGAALVRRIRQFTKAIHFPEKP